MDEQSYTTRDGKLWEGSLSKLIATIDKTTSNYSDIVNALKDMGCIEQRARGGGSANSIWLLVTPPTFELSQYIVKDTQTSKLQRKVDGAVEVMGRRITDQDEKIDLLIRHIRTLDERVKRLEGQLNASSSN